MENKPEQPEPDEERLQVFHIPDTKEMVALEKDAIRGLQKVAFILERMNLSEYISLMQNPRRLVFMNFVAGLSRGFGVVIGMTFLFAVFLFVLGHMVDLPLIGKYIAQLVHAVNEELAAKKGF